MTDLQLAAGSGLQQYGQKLVSKNFDVQVASLGQARVMTRQLLNRVLGDLNPEFITLQKLYQMRRDTMLSLGMYYRKQPLLRLKWHMECEGHPDKAAVMDQIVRDRWGSYSRIALQKYDFGYKGMIQRFELGTVNAQYEDDNGSPKPAWASARVQPMVLDRPLPIPPEYARVHLDEATGKYDGMEVGLPFVKGNPKDNVIPADWTMWWTNEFEETDNNYYGYPLLGYGYRYWWSSWFRHHMEDRHFEQKADPPLSVSYPEGTYVDSSGMPHRNQDIALQIGDDLRGGATVAMPSTIYRDPDTGAMKTAPLWSAQFLTGGDNMSTFTASAEYLDVMKLRSMFVPEQALIEGIQGSGARATASVHASLFSSALEQEGDELLEGFNKRVIPRLQEANWGPTGPDNPPIRMVADGNADDDVAFLQALVTAAFTADPNALPIKWEDVLKQTEVPTYTKQEQDERKKVEDAAAAAQPDGAPADQVDGAPTGPTPGAPGVSLSGRYFKPREVIHLHQGSPTVKGRAPGWAHREGERRRHNTEAIAERLQTVAHDYYTDVFKAAADYTAGLDSTNLAADPPSGATVTTEGATGAAVASTAIEASPEVTTALAAEAAVNLAQEIAKAAIEYKLFTLIRNRVQGELASAYHAGTLAELSRLGLSADSFDVGRLEVQDWARERAGELITTLDSTLVDQHLKPYLEKRLQQPFAPIQLAQEISDKFANYPKWMAERVARTEATKGYNLSAADTWENVGVATVTMYDGLGGKSGKTDAECLRRNGESVTIDEFRDEVEKEHPNGTLGAVPDIEDVQIHPPAGGTLVGAANLSQSETVYAVDEHGFILTIAETGTVMAGD